jgi:hypothetical protein
LRAIPEQFVQQQGLLHLRACGDRGQGQDEM